MENCAGHQSDECRGRRKVRMESMLEMLVEAVIGYRCMMKFAVDYLGGYIGVKT